MRPSRSEAVKLEDITWPEWALFSLAWLGCSVLMWWLSAVYNPGIAIVLLLPMGMALAQGLRWIRFLYQKHGTRPKAERVLKALKPRDQ